ncbi:hypothetical protein GCM10022237_40640 [Nocardioides ginsengisoli]|uniref:Response regulator transcription factor n=1 Tax=Nocardioides ginsengisoli TaxID=363868 RepID=A0ABW3W682_9ACTN
MGPTRVSRITVLARHELFAETLELALTRAGHEVHRITPYEQTLPPARMLQVLQRARPEILLVEPEADSSDTAVVLRTLSNSGVLVVVLTEDVDRARWGQWLWLGAHSVVATSVRLDTLLDGLSALASGKELMPREERHRLMELYQRERSARRASREQLASLTQREREVLAHLMYGDSVSDIAEVNVVAEATVRTQVRSILRKLGVTSQLAAVSIAYRARWQPAVPDGARREPRPYDRSSCTSSPRMSAGSSLPSPTGSPAG